MKTKKLKYSALAFLASGMFVTSCVDSDYDLTDVDGTAQVQVKDLVLPVNIDEISLRNIFDIDGESHIQEINGEYVLIDSGTYESDVIEIPSISAPAPSIAPIGPKLISLKNNGGNVSKSVSFLSLPLRFDIGEQLSEFTYEQDGLSEYLVDITRISANFDITIDLVVDGIDEFVNSWSMVDLEMYLPKGLTGTTNYGKYDKTTGIVKVDNEIINGSTLRFIMNVEAVDMKEAGAIFDSKNHTFCLKDKLGIRKGEVVVNEGDIKPNIDQTKFPMEIPFTVKFNMGELNVTSFAGKVQYSIDGVDISDIAITGLPKILSDSLTDISLVNPQIYVCFSNPLGTNYGLKAQTGLTLTAKRSNPEDNVVCSIDNGVFELSCNGCQGCQFCLSPTDPGQGNYWGKFVNAQHIPFTSLSNILAGKGLPKAIGISLDNLCIPVQEIKGELPLGTSLGKVTGCYTIFAPLQFKPGSKIIYSSTEDGWSDEDLEKMTITKLEISALISNNFPLDIEITGQPIDVEGNIIEGVYIEGAQVSSGAEDSPITITITGEIKKLDGITFVAAAIASEDQLVLRPEEHIVLKEVKAKVSGSYETEF